MRWIGFVLKMQSDCAGWMTHKKFFVNVVDWHWEYLSQYQRVGVSEYTGSVAVYVRLCPIQFNLPNF